MKRENNTAIDVCVWDRDAEMKLLWVGNNCETKWKKQIVKTSEITNNYFKILKVVVIDFLLSPPLHWFGSISIERRSTVMTISQYMLIEIVFLHFGSPQN